MKKKKQDPQIFMSLGIGLIAVSVVFISAINEAIGLAFLAMGVSYMVFGIIKSKKKK